MEKGKKYGRKLNVKNRKIKKEPKKNHAGLCRPMDRKGKNMTVEKSEKTMLARQTHGKVGNDQF